MSTFHRDLDQGKKVEDIVLAKIHEKYPLATKLEGKVKPYDIYIPELNIYVEVKSDKKSQETGNIVIEVEMYDKPKDSIEVVGIRPGEKLDEKLVSEKEIPFTHIWNDLILIKQKENTGENKLEEEYTTITAEKMTREEIIELCTV